MNDTSSVLYKMQIISFTLFLFVSCFCGTAYSKCEIKAIFNFGDSNSDTGGFWAAFPAQSGPFGMTFFKKPVGRATDGRLVVDFIAQGLGLPFISPYLQSIGSSYRHGANFATLASTVLLPKTSLFVTGLSPFSLAIQLNQMKEFKLKVDQFSTNNPSIVTDVQTTKFEAYNISRCCQDLMMYRAQSNLVTESRQGRLRLEEFMNFKNSEDNESIATFSKITLKKQLTKQMIALKPLIDGCDAIVQAQSNNGRTSILALAICQMFNTFNRKLIEEEKKKL